MRKILEEIIVENFPKMGKEIIIQVQETQRVPDRNNPRQNTPRHVLIILPKVKHKQQMLKAKREKQQITHKGIPIRITVDLSIGVSPKQDKPKAKHPKTHINQINKDQTQRTDIKSSKGKTTNNTQGDSYKNNS